MIKVERMKLILIEFHIFLKNDLAYINFDIACVLDCA